MIARPSFMDSLKSTSEFKYPIIDAMAIRPAIIIAAPVTNPSAALAAIATPGEIFIIRSITPDSADTIVPIANISAVQPLAIEAAYPIATAIADIPANIAIIGSVALAIPTVFPC